MKITFQTQMIKDFVLNKIKKEDISLLSIKELCQNTNLTFGYRVSDFHIMKIETSEGMFHAYFLREEPILATGIYSIADYEKRIELLTNIMIKMNKHEYDIQLEEWD